MSKTSKKQPPEDRKAKAGARNPARDAGGDASKDGDASRPAIDVRAIAAGELEVEPFPRVEHGFRVYISEDAFDRAVARGQKDTSREIGGVLVGVVRRDDAGPYVRVDTTIDALHAEEKGAELTFTHDTWQHIHEQMDTVHQGKRLVGWYHTHPGFGIFLSDRDQFIHHSFFDLPFQVAMVYDPKSREHGVFTWREGNLERSRRYWVGSHEHTWDGPRHSAADAGHEDGGEDAGTSRGARRAERASGDTEREAGFDWFAMGLLGLILVLLAGFGGHWYGKQQVLQQATVAIVQAEAAGARQAVQSLNVELLDSVRAAVDKDSVRVHVQDIVSELDRALTALDSSKAAPAEGTDEGKDEAEGKDEGKAEGKDDAGKAVARIKRARRAAMELLDEQKNVAAMLTAFRNSARGGGSAEARALAMQQNALGTLYSELARDLARAGDTQRAARYLQTAALVDPGGHERYQKQLNEFAKGAKLVVPRDGPAAPQSAPDRTRASDKASDKASGKEK